MQPQARAQKSPARRFAAFVAPARARRGFWRVVLALIVVAAVQALAFAAAFGALALSGGPQLAGDWAARLSVASTPASALALLATFLPLIAGLWLGLRLLHRRRLRSALGARVWRDAARGAAVGLAVFAPVLALAAATGATQPNLPPGLWLALLPLTLAGIAVQTFAEEAVFRGYLTQQIAARFRTPLAWGLGPALAFGLLHYDPGRMGEAAPVIVAVAVLFGLLAADLTARSGGIGLAWGLHLANNTVGLALMATQGTITGLALRVTTHDQGDIAQQPLLLIAGAVPVLIAWAVLRRGLRR